MWKSRAVGTTISPSTCNRPPRPPLAISIVPPGWVQVPNQSDAAGAGAGASGRSAALGSQPRVQTGFFADGDW
ncbi:hypothetical protein [Bradyrhizobium liaoningense]|uniref:hypothetical protein n=1 Tax=Bradyrhizobium liaoningense TaxID=43992 RepID=UPI001BA773D8|nr:hypothetical protein [Bradyrhizobium liaoningense]MBR0719165.1 hypothetical protein [Bradyrhizobium liaoningense]